MSASKSLNRILASPGNNLQPLIDHARRLEALTNALQGSIDQPFADHIRLGNLSGDVAIITVDSPAWLGKIRYLAPTLLEILHHHEGLTSLQKIQFKVVPDAVDLPPPLTAKRRTVLSPQGAEILRTAAAGLKNPELAAALLRLARQAETREDQ